MVGSNAHLCVSRMQISLLVAVEQRRVYAPRCVHLLAAHDACGATEGGHHTTQAATLTRLPLSLQHNMIESINTVSNVCHYIIYVCTLYIVYYMCICPLCSLMCLAVVYQAQTVSVGLHEGCACFQPGAVSCPTRPSSACLSVHCTCSHPAYLNTQCMPPLACVV